MCTNTARSTEAEQRLCFEALTSEVGLLQNYRAYKKWILLSMEKKSFLSKESDTKILKSIYFAYEVAVSCRGGVQTGRRPRASTTGGHPMSEITNI